MKHMLSSALIAGFVVGLLSALLQFLLVQPDIVLAERYESGDLVHFAGVAAAEATAPDAHAASQAADPDHDAAPSPLLRLGLTVLMSVLTYCGYGLVLMGILNLARQIGIKVGLAQGVLWGLAGFLAFQMMPALGLPPELPGMPAADLTDRRIWWAVTAISTGIGLWFIAYGSVDWQRILGAGVLAAPQIWGAPKVADFAGIVPPELAASFAAHSLGVGLITWLVLGGLLVTLWHSDPAR